MPSVGVIFEIRKAQTLPGEAIRVAGARPELGAWDPRGVVAMQLGDEDILRLKTGALRYPNWSMSAPVWFNFEHEAVNEELKEAAEGADSDSLSTVDSLDSASSSAATPQASTPKREQTETDFGIPNGTKTITLEYKFLKDRRQLQGDDVSSLQWESKIENRRVSVPLEPGSMWLVSDERWELDEPARASRVVQADVLSLCMELDPEYVLGRNKAKLSYSLTPDRLHGTPSPSGRRGLRPGEKQAFAIEEEFEVLNTKQLPSLLAEKLAAEKTAGELASEVMSMQRESALAAADKEHAQEEAKALRDEVAQLKEAMMSWARRAEASCKEQASEVRSLREENSGLRKENGELASKLLELRAELSGARDALKAVQEAAEPRTTTPGLEPLAPELPTDLCAAEELSSPVAARARSQSSSTSTGPQGGDQAPLRRRVNSGPDPSRAPASPSSQTNYQRSYSATEGLLDCEERAARLGSKELNELFVKTRSSLNAAPLLDKEGSQEEAENELMQVLRRRRERNGC